MAELKLSTVWEIKNYATDYCPTMIFESDDLPELQHQSLPGLKWSARFGEAFAPSGFADLWLCADFGQSLLDVKCAWASVNTSLLRENGAVVASPAVREDVEFTLLGWEHGEADPEKAFKIEDVKTALHENGSLRIRIDLTILKISELLKCRKLLRVLLANKATADFDVTIGGETIKLHKAVLAEASSVFAAMFESGLEEALEGALVLPDTQLEAFRALSEAIYCDNWNFLSELELTEQVLYLAEKYNVGDLKRYCDESLAEKVNEANALEILTKSAALCNAEKTKEACITLLAEHLEFKESEMWLDFKKLNRELALDICDGIMDKMLVANSALKFQYDELKREHDAAATGLSALSRKVDTLAEGITKAKQLGLLAVSTVKGDGAKKKQPAGKGRRK